MKIRIEPVTSLEQEAAAAWVRRQVFGTEWATELCRMAPDERPRASQLIARVLPDDEVVATLTLIGTTGNHALHDKYELPFNGADRVGRYTQMAVLKPYRGLNLPLYLLLEARRLFVVGNFTHTWLLFRADRAITSRFCRMLDFSASSHIVQGEEGPCRVLLRAERTHRADLADLQTRRFLDKVRPKQLQVIPPSETGRANAVQRDLSLRSGRPCSGLVREDEWVAH
jgi:hypothetical protein